ncbi:MAG: hypothetical protein IPK88_15590 [Saprospiraceae bacterium]|nr:hypothetical protein [Candidatus Defluviibacterium haderslevense]
MNKLRISWAIFTMCIIGTAKAQMGTTSDIPIASEFAIPISPAFDLIGVNNALVARPGNIRDFKVDWSFKSWRLKPNIALQAQPIWEILYNRSSLDKYRKASKLMQMLSTVDVSAGTIEDETLVRRLSWATKITLYRQKDALLNPSLFQKTDSLFNERRVLITEKLEVLKNDLKKQKVKEKRDSIKALIEEVDFESDLLDIEQKRNNLDIASAFAKKNWNASFIDVAFGRIYSYTNDTLSKLNLKGRGIAGWANFSIGIGPKILLTSLIKAVMISDDFTGFNTNILSAGINFRYGSPKFNFFAEGVYSKSNNNSIFDNKTINLSQANALSTSYGGDWRLSRNVMLSYGIRVDYSETIKFQRITPIAGIACMMR